MSAADEDRKISLEVADWLIEHLDQPHVMGTVLHDINQLTARAGRAPAPHRVAQATIGSLRRQLVELRDAYAGISAERHRPPA